MFIYGNLLAPWALWIAVRTPPRELVRLRLGLFVLAFLFGAIVQRPHYMHGAWTCLGGCMLGTIFGHYMFKPPKPPKNVRARAKARAVSFVASVRKALPKRKRRAPVRKPVPA